jgi:hypothetical protein
MYSRSSTLYTDDNDQNSSLLSASPVALLFFVLLFVSLYPLPAFFAISCCQMHALAQTDKISDDPADLVSYAGTAVNLTASGLITDETKFLNYTNSFYGFQIKYPSDWDIVLPETIDSNRNDSNNLNVVSIFSSPTNENVTINIGRLIEEPRNPVDVKQFISNVMNNSRNAFAEYRLLDLRISSDAGSNLTMDANDSEFNASSDPIIFNLTYSADQNVSNDRSHVRGMEVGAITNETAYVISYRATVENYDTYLPIVLEMIYSFQISALNNSYSSQALEASVPGSSSNASAMSREQNTVIEPGTANSSPNNSNSNPNPSAGTQQTAPNYSPPAPNVASESAYPTTQFYPPGYSAYPPGYSGYSPYTGYSAYPPGYSGYSPYTGYSAYPPGYSGYSPDIVIDPFIPTTPVIPPVDYTNPTIQSYNTYNDTAGVFHIVGQVENSSPYLITSVQIIAAFYDNLNQLLAVKFAYSNPPSIPSGQVAFFDLTIPPGTIPVDKVSQWTLRLVWQ